METIILQLITIFIVSLLPITEVRGSIPLAFAFFRNDQLFPLAIALAVLGNLLVAPLVLYVLPLLEGIFMCSRYVPLKLKMLYTYILRYARRRSREVDRYGFIGLAIFVGIPLPATGAYTGALIAYIIGMDRGKAIASIEIGVLIASLIVFIALYLGIEIVKKIFALP